MDSRAGICQEPFAEDLYKYMWIRALNIISPGVILLGFFDWHTDRNYYLSFERSVRRKEADELVWNVLWLQPCKELEMKALKKIDA